MWTRIALGLIAFLGVCIVAAFAAGGLSVRVDLPPGSTPASPAWMAGWIFVLFSAAIVIGVFLVRTAVRLISRKPVF